MILCADYGKLPPVGCSPSQLGLAAPALGDTPAFTDRRGPKVGKQKPSQPFPLLLLLSAETNLKWENRQATAHGIDEGSVLYPANILKVHVNT